STRPWRRSRRCTAPWWSCASGGTRSPRSPSRSAGPSGPSSGTSRTPARNCASSSTMREPMRQRLLDLDAGRLDEIIEAFETARADYPDSPVNLEDFLPAEADPFHLPVLRELVRVDLELGWDRGRPPPLDDYLRRFPALSGDPAGLREITYEEFRLRRLAGHDPSPDEYERRYGVRTADWPRARPDGDEAGLRVEAA